MKPLAEVWRGVRTRAWRLTREVIPPPWADPGGFASDADAFPWRLDWAVECGGAGPGFSRRDRTLARERAGVVARAILGDETWEQLRCQGYLDVSSHCGRGITYRLRPGRRVEVRRAEQATGAQLHRYLCVYPAYPLPKLEFLAQLFLRLRDHEEQVLEVAIPQWYDAPTANTF